MTTRRIQFECDYGGGYIDITDRGDERNTTFEIIVEEVYANATEEDVIEWLKEHRVI
jgi:hypothetical protein